MSDLPAKVTSLAYFWTVQRPDGSGFAGTSHDRPVTRNGIAYKPEFGLTPTALTIADTMIGSTLEAEGGLHSDLMTKADIQAGRWDRAEFQLACGDWAIDEEPSVLCRGRMGAVMASDKGIRTSIDITPERLGEELCPRTSSECRATLGDRRCGVSLRSRTKRSRLIGMDGEWIAVESEDVARFAFGHLLWLSGTNCGVRQTIVQADAGRIRLREQPPLPASIGDRLKLTEGCDGRLETCSERFDNVANFRGEPFVPGTDFLMRYPGA